MAAERTTSIGVVLILILGLPNLIVISPLSPPHTGSGNLLLNPGFDDGFVGWGISYGKGTFSLDSSAQHFGCCSVRGEQTDSHNLSTLYQDVTQIAVPGRKYQVSGWVMTNDSNAVPVISLAYVDSKGYMISGEVVYVGYAGITNGWTYVQSQNATLPAIPEGAVALHFALLINYGVTAWWDDLSLVCDSCPPSPAVITSVTGISTNTNGRIVIQGSGFGDTPPVLYQVGDGSLDTVENSTTPSMDISDFCHALCAKGTGNGWEAGHRASVTSNWDAIGIFLAGWSNSEIVVNGFGSALSAGTLNGGACSGPAINTMCPGDKIVIRVWGPNLGPIAVFSETLQSPPNGLQSIPGTFVAQGESGDEWNLSNSMVCPRIGNVSLCEATSTNVMAMPGLHSIDNSGDVVPFVGTVQSFGVTLVSCQPAFGSYSSVASGKGVVGSCFDQAIITSGAVGGNIKLAVNLELPTEVAGNRCDNISGQITTLSKHKVSSLGSSTPATFIGQIGTSVICQVSVVTDVNLVATSSTEATHKTSFAVILMSPFTIVCRASPIGVGLVTICRATVTGAMGGTVQFSSAGSGYFSSPTCTLSALGTCQVNYNPLSAVSPNPITARYSGNLRNIPTSSVFPLSIKAKATRTAVSCDSSKISISSGSSTCTAYVTGWDPRGNVVWSQTGPGSVLFTPSSCQLTAGKCTVKVSGSSAGVVHLVATYLGDPSNLESARSRSLSVKG